jgi:hypothetical protein
MITDGIKRRGRSGKLSACLTVVLALFLYSPAAFSSNDGTCLTLKAAARVEQASVRLSDIATLTGTSQNQLKDVGRNHCGKGPTARADPVRGDRLFTHSSQKAGIDTTSIVFKGPQDVRITRQAAALPTQRIQRAVEMAIRSRMPWKNEIGDHQRDHLG